MPAAVISVSTSDLAAVACIVNRATPALWSVTVSIQTPRDYPSSRPRFCFGRSLGCGGQFLASFSGFLKAFTRRCMRRWWRRRKTSVVFKPWRKQWRATRRRSSRPRWKRTTALWMMSLFRRFGYCERARRSGIGLDILSGWIDIRFMDFGAHKLWGSAGNVPLCIPSLLRRLLSIAITKKVISASKQRMYPLHLML